MKITAACIGDRKIDQLQIKNAILVSLFLLLVALFPQPLPASTIVSDTQGICDQVAQVAADHTGVPLTVLQAITRAETGRKHLGKFGPWPWTVNMEGKGVWFASLDEARAYVFKNFKRGARSFDVGCFQINYKWHHQNFTSIDEMFDPEQNALYAARFLRSLHDELGDWSKAAGAYHSRTPKHADRYRRLFEQHRARAPGKTVIAEAVSPVRSSRQNTFPLLRSGGPVRLGSLVPAGSRASAGQFIRFNRPEE